MYRLSTIIEDVYATFLPVAEKRKIRLNLDFPDPTKRVDRPSRIKNPLPPLLEGAISRAKTEVSLEVKSNCVKIKDDGPALPPSVLEGIKKEGHIDAKSRVGFGTEFLIKY